MCESGIISDKLTDGILVLSVSTGSTPSYSQSTSPHLIGTWKESPQKECFQPIVTVVTNPADQPDKGLGFGSFLSSKGFARGCLPASSPSSGISNPLLCPPTPSQDDVYSSSTFLQGAERAARNEVQV
uniref:Uncharacterized protein n=1 Tax=Timema douglasi TaxID=61478 RepID=A0A7R8VGN2_TIMDO|nr:unnamed protein product [Timema douglasi]